MRERRGHLRDWGYGFRTDGPRAQLRRHAPHPGGEHGDQKRAHPPPAPQTLNLRELETAREEDILTTRSDHWGLRLRIRDQAMEVFPRMCPHEGACLDSQSVERGSVKCPWHGRVLRPLATLPFPWYPNEAAVDLRHPPAHPRRPKAW